MSQPLNTGMTALLPFEQRLLLVGEAVEQRIRQTPATNHFEVRARLWVQWLKRNVLDVPVHHEVRA